MLHLDCILIFIKWLSKPLSIRHYGTSNRNLIENDEFGSYFEMVVQKTQGEHKYTTNTWQSDSASDYKFLVSAVESGQVKDCGLLRQSSHDIFLQL